MSVIISVGNTKLGKIPNVSLPPIKSCGNCSKCKRQCYAMKAYRLYPSVKTAWDNNMFEATYNRNEYFLDISSYLKKKKPKYFRWHISGDILDEQYFMKMVQTANTYPDILFCCFTKMYDLINQYLRDLRVVAKFKLPANLKIYYSIWKDEKIDNPYKFSTARTVDKGKATDYDGFICPGSCEGCMLCFEGLQGSKVIFEIH